MGAPITTPSLAVPRRNQAKSVANDACATSRVKLCGQAASPVLQTEAGGALPPGGSQRRGKQPNRQGRLRQFPEKTICPPP